MKAIGLWKVVLWAGNSWVKAVVIGRRWGEELCDGPAGNTAHCLTFLYCAFSNGKSTHWLYLFDFSLLCYREAMGGGVVWWTSWQHYTLFDFSPQCVLKWQKHTGCIFFSSFLLSVEGRQWTVWWNSWQRCTLYTMYSVQTAYWRPCSNIQNVKSKIR